MKKTVTYLICLVLATFLARAQDNIAFKSKIKLKDGSELQVVIIENVPGDYIRIKLPGNETATISYTDILSIKHKDYSYEQPFDLPRGFLFEVYGSLLFGKPDEYSVRAGLAIGTTANYRFYPGLSLGVGVEPTMATGFLLMPVYAHIAGDFKKRRVGLTYFADAGWSLARNTGIYYQVTATDGGWFLRPGVGLRLNQFTLTVAYQVQKVTSTIQTSPRANEQWLIENRTMRHVVLGVRYVF